MLKLQNNHKDEDPLSSPCKGEARYLFRLRFPNYVSAIFHSSLFTKEANVTSLPLTGG